jgi:hypothetical protein
MHSSSVPSAIKYGRAPRVALTRSWLSDGHFRRTAGAAKLILTSVSDIPNNPGEILSRQQSFIMFLPSQGALFWGQQSLLLSKYHPRKSPLIRNNFSVSVVAEVIAILGSEPIRPAGG